MSPKLTCLFLGEPSVFADVVPEVSAREIVHDKVQILPVLERIIHIDDVWVVQLSQDLSLIHHRLETALGQDSCLGHFLHCIILLRLFAFDLPHLAEAALSNAIHVSEMTLRERYQKRIQLC